MATPAAAAVEGLAVTALRSVMQRARQAAERSGRHPGAVRVVAVSKTKPASLVRQVYDGGHRCFGENYVQEIIDKAPQLPEDIEWHFVGHLQSNKVKSLLAAVPNLAMVEGVDNEKVANHLDRAVSNLGRKPLRVMVQVNTSGETSKSGVDPPECVELAKHIKLGCPNLQFSGLMTIGMPDYTSTPANFKALLDCRFAICKALGIPEPNCELSMGMSGDFEQAIEMGSTNNGARQCPTMMIEAVQQTGMESCVCAVEGILKYSFRNRKLLEDALTHRSFTGSASYERLEFLGDAAIGLAFTNFLYLSYPALDEGSLSLLRSVNLCNERLARVAVRHHLYRFVRHKNTVLADAVNEFILAVMEEDKIAVFGGAVKAPKVLADIVESIAAAVYIDCEFDLKAFWMVFRVILEPTITWEVVQEQPQPVTKLLQLCHKQRKQVHIKQWREKSVHFASVYVDDELVGSCSSAHKDTARLNAAREAVKNLEERTMLVDEVTTVEFEVDDNNEIIAAKQKLNGICRSKKWPMPSYRVVKVEGVSYDKSQRYVCSVQVKVGETVLSINGDGRSRPKDAECSAASCMVYSLLESGYVQRRIDPKRMAIDKL